MITHYNRNRNLGRRHARQAGGRRQFLVLLQATSSCELTCMHIFHFEIKTENTSSYVLL